MTVFIIKKVISGFLMPLPFGLLCCIAGLLLLWFSRRQLTGKLLVSLGTLVLLLFSLESISNALIEPLELAHTMSQKELDAVDGEYVVVLGGGHNADERRSALDQLEYAAPRLVAGVSLARKLGIDLIVSGGGAFSDRTDAGLMKEAAMALGFPESGLVVEDQSKDTIDQAVYLKQILAERPFMLVAEASHLPRATRIFRHYGMDPTPVPSHHLSHRPQPASPVRIFPSSKSLYRSSRAIYEYLGTLWFWLRYQLL